MSTILSSIGNLVKPRRAARHAEQHQGSDQPQASLLSGILITVGAWFVTRVVVGAGWGPVRNPFTFDPSEWFRWDSFNYLAIVEHGSTFGRCGSPGMPVSFASEYFHLHWCGTASWLPGYPWLVRAVNTTGLSVSDAAVLIPWLAIAAAMFLIWMGWGRDLPVHRALVLLLLFGLFPGSVYNFAVFPTSVALACVAAALVAATHERFLIGALFMILAGLCYPSALFAATGLALGLVLLAVPRGPAAVVRRGLWGLAGLASLLVIGIYYQLSFGRFDAYWLLVHQDEPTLNKAMHEFFKFVVTQKTVEQMPLGRFSAVVLSIQAVEAIALCGSALVVAALAGRRHERDASLLYPALAGIVIIVGMLLAANGSAWSRSVVVAAPCVVCLRRAPFAVQCALVVILGVTTAVVSHSFFAGTLV